MKKLYPDVDKFKITVLWFGLTKFYIYIITVICKEIIINAVLSGGYKFIINIFII